jgi:OmpA-OmpF porin, OOP family
MKAHRVLVAAAVAAVFTPAMAQQKPGNEGYLVDTRNLIVTSGAGQCWHTQQWRPALAVEPCDPVPRKVVVAPEPRPAPPPPQVQAAPPPPPPPPKIVVQSVELAADTLFPFDEASLQPEGESALNNFARQLSDVRVNSVVVVGHADRIGPPEYNQKLSERRAIAVKEYLASAVNIPANRINVEPKGATEPVTRREDCPVRGDEAIACLAPDRRVHVEVTGTKEVKQSPQK